MNTQGHKLHIYYLSAALLTVLCTALRVLALTLSFDRDIGYFTPHSALPIFLRVFEIVALLWFFTLPFLMSKGALPAEKPAATLPHRAAAALVTLVLVLNVADWCRVNTGRGLYRAVLILGIPLLLLAAAWFLLTAIGVARRDLFVTFGCFAVLAVAFLIAFTYFDNYTPMNAPHKTGLHLALVAFLFYILYRLRDAAGIAMPRARALASMAAFFLCFTVGVSDLIAYPIGVFTDASYLLQDLLLIGFATLIGTAAAAEARSLTPPKEEQKV